MKPYKKVFWYKISDENNGQHKRRLNITEIKLGIILYNIVKNVLQHLSIVTINLKRIQSQNHMYNISMLAHDLNYVGLKTYITSILQ
jgi:hypothetical protein